MKPVAWYHKASMRIRWQGDNLPESWIPLYAAPPKLTIQGTNFVITVFTDLPAGYDERTTLWLTPDNRVALAHPDMPSLVYDEEASRWTSLIPANLATRDNSGGNHA